jgi:8-oxo-dGTP diphosphatase
MPICINKKGDIFEEFLEIPEESISRLELEFPITHALVVAKNKNGYLLIFNSWKKNWELAGGILEEGETLRECALREMHEETNQIPERIAFRGLMKFKLRNGRTEYGGLFCAWITEERPFEINQEAREMVFWNGHTDIGYIDDIDQELLKYYNEP